MRRVLPILLLVPCLLLAQPPIEPRRKRIGVALGGGGALGLAHVGVLMWLEKNHIPVDVIAGTSIGAIIGGSYATGMSASEVELLIQAIDWNSAFRGTAPYSDLNYRRKEDRHAFPNRFELGIKNGLKTPSGLTSGFGLTLLLDKIFIGIPSNRTFDQLATPFRCIATDLVSGDRVEISEGPLAEALRASSAIPGLFEPVRRNDQVLVDGGVVDNLPVDAARELGADAIIASVLPVAKLKADEIQGLSNVLARSISIGIMQNERISEKKAQVVLIPDVSAFSTTDYEQHDALIKKGIEAAEAARAQLIGYAVSDAEWVAFIRGRAEKRRATNPIFRGVDVTGGTKLSRQRIQTELTNLITDGEGPRAIDPEEINEVLFKEYGTGRYSSAGYSSSETDGKVMLDVKLVDKLHGPPFLNFGPEISGEDTGRTDLTLKSRITFYEFLGRNAELRGDLSIGSHTQVGAEYYHRLGSSGWFYAPRALFDRKDSNYYVAGKRLGIFDVHQALVGVDVGFTSRLDNEFRLGFDYGRIGARSVSGPVPAAGQDGVLKAITAKFVHDGQDSEQVPSRGLKLTAIGRYIIDAPVSSRFPLVRVDASWFHPIGKNDRVFVSGIGASSFGNALPVPLQFSLGGPLRLGAYGLDEFRGDRVGYANAGWLRRIGSLPAVVGGHLFLGGWYEVGNYSSLSQQGSWRQNGTIAFVAETPIGPVYAGWSLGHAADRWKGKFSFLLGRFF